MSAYDFESDYSDDVFPAFWPTLLVLLVPVASYIAMVWFPINYINLIGEDKFGEFGTAVACGVASVLFALAALRLGGVQRALTVVFALGCFFIAGEEISWGQRILGLGTPDFLREVNVQGELTLHNIEAFHYTPYREVVGTGLLGMALFLLVPGLLAWVQGWVPMPSRSSWAVCAFAGIGLIVLMQFDLLIKGDEVAELMLGVALLVWGANVFSRQYGLTEMAAFLPALAVALALSVTVSAVKGSTEFSTAWRYKMLALRDYPNFRMQDQSLRIMDHMIERGYADDEVIAARGALLAKN